MTHGGDGAAEGWGGLDRGQGRTRDGWGLEVPGFQERVGLDGDMRVTRTWWTRGMWIVR